MTDERRPSSDADVGDGTAAGDDALGREGPPAPEPAPPPAEPPAPTLSEAAPPPEPAPEPTASPAPTPPAPAEAAAPTVPEAAPPEPTPAPGPPPEPTAPGAAPPPSGAVSAGELERLQAAEEAKSDPALDDVEAASIEVQEGDRPEPFDKLAQRAKKLSAERVRAVVEALLFVAEKPLPPEEIRAASGIELARVRAALDELSGHYREGVSGIVLHEVAGGWQLRSSPDVAEYARRFLRVKPQRLTRAALETLAIIAYRQPVTRPEIEDVRGVDSGAVVKALLERKLIKILGKKEEPGRPILYGTSREFLEFFALKDLASLPTLREFHELSEEHRDIVEKEAPAPEEPGISGIVSELADPALRAALEAKQAEGDAALAELERAMEAAETTTRSAEQALAPPQAAEAGGPAGAAPTTGEPGTSGAPEPPPASGPAAPAPGAPGGHGGERP